jgi:hypothetical protein
MPLDLSVVCRVGDPDDALAATIASVQERVAEVWILDPDGATDGRSFGSARRAATSHGGLEQATLDACSASWVLWLEPDEIAHASLLDRIERLAAEGALARMGGYRVTVRTVIAEGVLRAGNGEPRSSLRLFRRPGSRFAPRPGAQFIAPPAGQPLGRLREPIEERPFRDFDSYLRRADRQITREFAGNWPSPRTLHLLTVWPATFVRHWILAGGYRDGKAGALWAGARASAEFLRAMRIWVHAHAHERGAAGATPRAHEDRT